MNIKQYLQADKNIQHLLSSNDKLHIAQSQLKKHPNSNFTVKVDQHSTITKSLSTSSALSRNCESFNLNQLANSSSPINPHIKLRNLYDGPHSARISNPQTQINYKINLSSKSLNLVNRDLLGGREDQLCHLDLSWNNLAKFDLQLLNLKDLNLQANQITGLPPQFAEMVPQLEIFNVSKNLLQQIPTMPHLLTQLYISHNLLHIFPRNIAQLSNLLILHFQGNPLYLLGNIPESVEEIGLDWIKYAKGKEINRGEMAKKIKNWLNSNEISEKTFINFVTYILTGSKFNPETKDSFGRTMLHRAALAQDLGVIIGLRGKIDPNILDGQDLTPLFLAIKEGAFNSAKYLLQIDANPNIKCGPYGSVISLSLVKQQFNLVHLLLQKGADPNTVDKDGNTPLHYLMALWRDEEQIRQVALSLLAKGACTNIRNHAGYAPLHMCIRKGQVGACKFAINYLPAKQRITSELLPVCSHSFDIDIKCLKNGKTPLKLAALYNITGIVKVLLEENVDLTNIQIMSTANAVAKMLKRSICEWQMNTLLGKKSTKNGSHRGYFGYCSFHQESGLTINKEENNYKQSDHDWYFSTDRQNVLQQVKSFSCQPNRMTQRSQKDLRSLQALHRLQGDQELIISESNCTNDSKNEGKGPKPQINQQFAFKIKLFLEVRSVVGERVHIQKMNVQMNELLPSKANILSYNGLRTPKLYNAHTEALSYIYQKWTNIVNYFTSTGNHYQKFVYILDIILSENLNKMKLVGLMIKMHIQVVNLHRKIQNEIQKISVKGKLLENGEKYLMMNCIMGSLDEVLIKEKEEDEFEQSLIQEEVQCQLQEQHPKEQEQNEQMLNNLSFGSLVQSQKCLTIQKQQTFEHERRVQIIDMLMQFVHRNFKYSVEMNSKVNLLSSYECVQGRLYQQVKSPL